MKILFVDDEPRILRAIERMLFDMVDEWEMDFVTSAVEALEFLEHDPVDVIVTDMRMPGMDGAELLKEIQGRSPNIVRIILSGHTEMEAALRALPVAHQFLSKPCDPELLKSVIERACSLQEMLNDSRIKNVIGTLDNLPSVPRVYSQLLSAVADQRPAADIAKIISQDQAMSVKVLQIVNSSFFGGSGVITNIESAVVRLGVTMIKNIILSVEVFQDADTFHDVPGFSIDEAQKNALSTAALAKEILNDKSTEDEVVLAAMLHDIGLLVMMAVLPDQLASALRLASAEGLAFHQAEKQLMGVTHAEIGGYLLGVWGFPYSIVEAVANHHEPLRVPGSKSFGVLEAVYIANTLVLNEVVNADYLIQWGVLDQLENWQRMALNIIEGDQEQSNNV